NLPWRKNAAKLRRPLQLR
ncbi:major tail protein V, partial [Escherichia coli 95.0183]